MKRCAGCDKTKPVEEFYIRSSNPASPNYGRRQSRCKTCICAERKKWRNDNPDLVRERQVGYRLKFYFGISLDEYNVLLNRQDGGCAVCGRPAGGRWGTLDVDHDHATGAVRGILCHECNTALGLLEEDPDLFTSAVRYLEQTAG